MKIANSNFFLIFLKTHWRNSPLFFNFVFHPFPLTTKLQDDKIRSGFEETTRIREELKHLMVAEPVLQNVKNHFVARGVDRVKIDIIVDQVFRDKEEKEKCLAAAKKRRMISLIFLLLFAAGVTGWFYIWGDWITYFAGVNLVLFLFFMQQAASFKGKAAIYE